MNKILVTGAEGFIGSHLVEDLLSNGYKVKAFVLYNSFNSIGWLNQLQKKKNLEIFFGDIRDEENIIRAMHGCSQIVHLAALISIPYSYYSSKNYFDTNLFGTMNILNASRKLSIKKIIVTSTSEVFGSCKKSPMNELHPINAQSPYAASKASVDQLCKSFNFSYRTPVVILRPFNTFGPRQSLRAIIPTIITQLIYSEELKIGNINTYRDFSYVKDISSAFIKVIKSNNKKIFGQEFNIGSGHSYKIIEIIDLIADILDKKKKIKIDKKRIRPNKSEVLKLIADDRKFRDVFKSSRNNKKNIKIALMETIDWYKKNINYFENIKFYNY